MSSIDWGYVQTAVVATAVIGAGGIFWAIVSGRAQRAWLTLGNVEGLRSIAVVALAAFVLASCAAIWHLWPVTFSVTTVYIGPDGSSANGNTSDPGFYHNTSGQEGKFVDVQGSQDFQICTLSHVLFNKDEIVATPDTSEQDVSYKSKK